MSHPILDAALPKALGLFMLVAGGMLPAQAQTPAASSASPAPSANAAADPANCAPILRQTFGRLQDEKPQSLCQYSGKVILVVNTASFCGFTPQYKGLEALHSKYKDRGLVVLGFPSNDFSQEGGSNKDIAEFCENTFGVKFPMFVKTSVRGPDANPLYRQLIAQTGKAPAWNFHKYLLGRDGRVVDSYTSMVAPDNPSFIRDLEKQLAAK